LLNFCIDFRIAELLIINLVEFRQVIQHPPAFMTVHTLWIIDKKDGIFSVAKLHTLVDRIEKTIRP
jgi:hypothetical protein